MHSECCELVARLVLNAHTDIIHISIVKCEVGINFTFICCCCCAWDIVRVSCVHCVSIQFYVRFRYTPIIIFSLNVALLLRCLSLHLPVYISWAMFNDDEKWWWFCSCVFHVANLKFSVRTMPRWKIETKWRCKIALHCKDPRLLCECDCLKWTFQFEMAKWLCIYCSE